MSKARLFPEVKYYLYLIGVQNVRISSYVVSLNPV